MTQVGDVELIAFLFAEDVRQEANGKFTLVGVVADGLQMADMPGRFPVAFYMELKLPTVGERALTFTIATSLGPRRAELLLKLNSSKPNTVAAVASPRFDIEVQEAGDLVVSASCDGSEPVEIARRSVTHNPDLARAIQSRAS